MQSLVSSASENAFQRGIYAAMLVVRGTILTTANQLDAAISKLEQGRAIYESLSKTGATNIANVAASDVKLGEAAAKAGHDQKAAEYFHRALMTAEHLISIEPADPDALYAAADAYFGLGELSMKKARLASTSLDQQRSHWNEARSWYQQSSDTWRRIQHPNHTAPNSFQVGDPNIVAKQLKFAEAVLASIH